MKRFAALVGGLLLIASCAPSIVAPIELESALVADEAFEVVLGVIARESYPETTTGWQIVQSDRAAGTVTARIDFLPQYRLVTSVELGQASIAVLDGGSAGSTLLIRGATRQESLPNRLIESLRRGFRGA